MLELMIVLVLVGVLASTAASRFFRSDDLTARSKSDMLLQFSRQLQLRSMQDVVGLQSRCPLLYISSTVAAMTSGCSNPALPLANPADPSQIQFQSGQLQSDLALPLLLRFDSKGRPAGSCSAGCRLTVFDNSTPYQLCIASSGFIRRC